MHTLLDDEPKILADPFACDLAGFDTDAALLAAHVAHPLAQVRGFRTQFALRNRYAEDELAAAVARGRAVRHPGCGPRLLRIPPPRPHAHARCVRGRSPRKSG